MARRLLFVVNEPYFFVSHRLNVGLEAIKQGFEVHIAAPNDHVWAPDGFSIGDLKTYGFHVHEISLSRRSIGPIGELRTLWSLFRLFQRVRPLIVHLITIKPVIYGGIAARLSGVPAVVYLVTGLGHVFSSQDIFMRVVRMFVVQGYKAAARHKNSVFMFQNEEDEGVLRRSGCRVGPSLVLPGSGVDLTKYKPAPEPTGDVVVLLAARLMWDKGVGDFVDAARMVRNKRRGIRFVVVGNTHPSNPRSVPADLLRKWADEGVVEWWGHRTDMPVVFAASHVVCLPSRYGEGLPKVLLEAGAVGRPSIASDIAGCRQVIRHEETGLLVPLGDVSSLAAAIERLADDSSLRHRLGETACRNVGECFSETDVVRKTMDVYHEILG